MKQPYVFAIAEHHVRDQVHAALRAGPDAVRARIRELTQFRARHASLEAYLDRLESYARPQKVKHEDACARVSDVWRCNAPAHVELKPLVGGEWRAKYNASPGREEWIVIDQKTGAMRPR